MLLRIVHLLQVCIFVNTKEQNWQPPEECSELFTAKNDFGQGCAPDPLLELTKSTYFLAGNIDKEEEGKERVGERALHKNKSMHALDCLLTLTT